SINLEADGHRSVRQISANQETARARMGQAGRWWAPTVDLYATYGLLTSREREFVSMQDRLEGAVGIRVSMDLFDGLHSRTEASALALQAGGFENQSIQASLELKARFENARQELKITHELVHSAEENAEQGNVYLSRTLAEYAKGVKNSPDVLSATFRYVEYMRRVAELKRDYQIVKADLLAIIGR
ncbi:MAG: TolC family protein, partial [Bdellovibrionota bacterium]